MEGGGRVGSCPQLLDLIPRDGKWMLRGGGGGGGASTKVHEVHTEEQQLDLRLGLPGPGEWSLDKEKEHPSVLSLGLFPWSSKTATNPCAGAKRGFLDTLESNSKKGYEEEEEQQLQKTGLVLHFEKADVVKPEQHLSHDKKASCSKATRPASATDGNGTVDSSGAQTRATPPAAVVGWPPVRSFRRNLASSSKPPRAAGDSAASQGTHKFDSSSKSMFVKINMEGVPIGRKVDLKACDGYDSLSKAVDHLFRGLLAAQKESPVAGAPGITQESPAITGLLDGSGEYTLVYEDNEGDKMLVGDVPWEMFASMVKRLRVLKSSELSSALTLGNSIRERTAPEAGEDH